MQHAQLWKRILNEGVNDLGLLENTEKLIRDVITAPIIVDGRIGEIADGGWKKESENQAFPFDVFFIEGDSESTDRPESKGSRWGALVQSRNRSDGRRDVVIASFGSVSFHRPICFGLIASILPSNVDGGTPWNAVTPPQKSTAMVLRETSLYVFDCLELLSCTNVSLQPHDNDPKQVRRAIKRHGGTPESYRYYTLVVRPPGARSDTPGQEIGIMPRHVCRGHRAYYGPAAIHKRPDGRDRGLLFGKYAGRFFIPPTLKGKKENGTVEKDYLIPAQ